jgi:hypothetical protein
MVLQNAEILRGDLTRSRCQVRDEACLLIGNGMADMVSLIILQRFATANYGGTANTIVDHMLAVSDNRLNPTINPAIPLHHRIYTKRKNSRAKRGAASII